MTGIEKVYALLRERGYKVTICEPKNVWNDGFDPTGSSIVSVELTEEESVLVLYVNVHRPLTPEEQEIWERAGKERPTPALDTLVVGEDDAIAVTDNGVIDVRGNEDNSPTHFQFSPISPSPSR